MNEDSKNQVVGRTKWVFLLIGIFALIWNIMGCLNFFMQISPDGLEKLPESHQAIASVRPFWVTVVFGISVTTGVLGAVLLLMKKRFSIVVFFISFVAAVVTTLHAIVFADILKLFSPSEMVLGVVGPLVAGALFVGFSIVAHNKHWIE